MEKENLAARVAQLVDGDGYRPLSRQGLASRLELPASQWPEFYGLLSEMEGAGRLILSKSGKVLNIWNSGYRVAQMRNLTKTGGFTRVENEDEDYFVKKENLLGAMPTDIVVIKPVRSGGPSREARIVKISKRNFVEFTGVFHAAGKEEFVAADQGVRQKIPALPGHAAKPGDKVLARFQNGSAEIIAVFGPSTSARSCADAVVRKYHVHTAFPEEVLAEARSVAARPVSAEGRLDLRGEVIFTIDSSTAKDLDDAVSLEKLPEGGWRLGVHIADVSHYVTPGSLLDKEAYARGTSIYYADNVIPMLPKELSNGVCSLNPQEDRPAFSVFMRLDPSGAITGGEFHKSLIRSRVKGVYAEINALFAGGADDGLRQKYKDVLPSLLLMRELSGVLSGKRGERGALDIESPDSLIETDENGRTVNVSPRVQGEAEILIENFMLSANETVAAYVEKLKMPLVYRVHDEPEPKKLAELALVLRALGIGARAVRPGITPRDFSAILQKLNESGRGTVLAPLVLRAMAKARYSPDCTGHFGLALRHYCHFTSPIRRYPDLCVHRILSDILVQGPSEALFSRYREFTVGASLASSEHEISAVQVERECESIYKAEYMTGRLGERFEGVIDSVRPFGFYVSLPSSVEGLVRVEELTDGYYEFDERSMQLVCRRNRRRFSLGDKVEVQVIRADVSSGQIDFRI